MESGFLFAPRLRPIDLRRGETLVARAWAWAILAVLLAPTLATAEAEWSLEKQENGISVHTRSVEGSAIKEFMGSAEIRANADSILRVLRDSDGFKRWFPNCPESKLLAREETVSYQYSVMSTPWPISDRDNIFRSVTTRSPSTGVIEIAVAAAPDYYPEQNDRVRVRKARGTWRLEPQGAEQTRVTFVMHLEPGGGIPAWMINARVVSTPLEALSNLRASVEN